MIDIVDYKMGNVGSILNMFKKIGVEARITSLPEHLSKARKLILPGVGAFDAGMSRLEEMGLLPILHERVLEGGVPILGICLGMQLMTESSEEGELRGLGWIKGKTVKFKFNPEQAELKIPHMGWNTVTPTCSDSLFHEMAEEAGFYFVHSYHVTCEDEADRLSATSHGYEFTSALQRGNIMGTQFHPEKSHRYGLALLKNFAEQVAC